jgi:hypothetical protein
MENANKMPECHNMKSVTFYAANTAILKNILTQKHKILFSILISFFSFYPPSPLSTTKSICWVCHFNYYNISIIVIFITKYALIEFWYGILS